MALYRRIDALVGAVSNVLAVIGAAASALIVILVATSVVWRLLFGNSIPGFYELIQVVLVFAIYLSMPFGVRKGSHIAVTLLTEAVSAAVAVWLRRIGLVVGLVILFFMVWATGVQAVETTAAREYSPGLVNFPIWPARIALCIGLFWFAVEILMTLIGTFDSKARPAATAGESELRGEAQLPTPVS